VSTRNKAAFEPQYGHWRELSTSILNYNFSRKYCTRNFSPSAAQCGFAERFSFDKNFHKYRIDRLLIWRGFVCVCKEKILYLVRVILEIPRRLCLAVGI
jgi:hypothetical protein